MASISKLTTTLGAGGRLNKYRVYLTTPVGVQTAVTNEEYDILAKAATAPSKEITPIEVFSQGRKGLIPGDTSYDNTWAATFYLTENHALRIAIIAWMDACDNFQANTHSGNPTSLNGEVKIVQLDSLGKETAFYTLHGCYPSSCGEISYSDDTDAGIGEFDITFAYTDWTAGQTELSQYDPATPSENDTAPNELKG